MPTTGVKISPRNSVGRLSATGPGQPKASARMFGVLAGTRLLTATGYRAVETLRRGDLVATLIGRGPMFIPVAWVGHRKIQVAEPDNPDAAHPVRIRRSAIADNMPNEDLLLAPDHAIYIEGALYLTKHLVNGASILTESRLQLVDYWGIELERHDLLVAQNLAIESLLAMNRAGFSEVTTPHLSIVGTLTGAACADPAPIEFASSIWMSARWFRRRLLARRNPVASAEPPKPLSPSPNGLLYIEAEARTALDRMGRIAAERGVQLEIAVEPDLTVGMEQSAFQDLLGAMLAHAIYALDCQRVLLGAMRHAGRVQVAMIDDGNGADRDAQERTLRPVVQLAAWHGGTLEVDARLGEGTTQLLRLLAPPQSR